MVNSIVHSIIILEVFITIPEKNHKLNPITNKTIFGQFP